MPFTHKASFAGEISQANEPERVPDGKIVPVNGKVNLAENSTVALQALTIPASILFRRPDGALLKPNLKPVGEGTVELRLDETNDLDLDKISLTIRNDGALVLR